MQSRADIYSSLISQENEIYHKVNHDILQAFSDVTHDKAFILSRISAIQEAVKPLEQILAMQSSLISEVCSNQNSFTFFIHSLFSKTDTNQNIQIMCNTVVNYLAQVEPYDDKSENVQAYHEFVNALVKRMMIMGDDGISNKLVFHLRLNNQSLVIARGVSTKVISGDDNKTWYQDATAIDDKLIEHVYHNNPSKFELHATKKGGLYRNGKPNKSHHRKNHVFIRLNKPSIQSFSLGEFNARVRVYLCPELLSSLHEEIHALRMIKGTRRCHSPSLPSLLFNNYDDLEEFFNIKVGRSCEANYARVLSIPKRITHYGYPIDLAEQSIDFYGLEKSLVNAGKELSTGNAEGDLITALFYNELRDKAKVSELINSFVKDSNHALQAYRGNFLAIVVQFSYFQSYGDDDIKWLLGEAKKHQLDGRCDTKIPPLYYAIKQSNMLLFNYFLDAQDFSKVLDNERLLGKVIKELGAQKNSHYASMFIQKVNSLSIPNEVRSSINIQLIYAFISFKKLDLAQHYLKNLRFSNRFPAMGNKALKGPIKLCLQSNDMSLLVELEKFLGRDLFLQSLMSFRVRALFPLFDRSFNRESKISLLKTLDKLIDFNQIYPRLILSSMKMKLLDETLKIIQLSGIDLSISHPFDFTNANLTEMFLGGIDFQNATLSGARIYDSHIYSSTIFPRDMSDALFLNPKFLDAQPNPTNIQAFTNALKDLINRIGNHPQKNIIVRCIANQIIKNGIQSSNSSYLFHASNHALFSSITNETSHAGSCSWTSRLIAFSSTLSVSFNSNQIQFAEAIECIEINKIQEFKVAFLQGKFQ